MKLSILLKQFLLAFMTLFISCILSACGSGTTSSGSNNNSAPVALGVLSNGSTLYTSTSSFPISDAGTPANGVLSLSGGTLASFTISFGDSALQGTQRSHTNTARLQNTDTNGIAVTPSSCALGTVGSGSSLECAYSISASESTAVGTYAIPIMATDSSGIVQNMGSITVLVSGTVSEGSRSITSYSLNGTAGVITGTNIAVEVPYGTAGVITGTNIAVEVPYGTDVNSLVATYITTGASVAVGSTIQTNGSTTNNFTSPVIYTVTAANGLTKEYTVNVTVATMSSKAITAYSLNGTAGVITGNNITVEMPFGSTLSSLVATFTTDGENVDVNGTTQNSGTTVNDFSSPVVYTVTAADGSTQDYTVTVTVAANSAKAITEFSLDGTAGVITGTDIAVEMPSGTDINEELIATFTTTGNSVTVAGVPQISGTTANNFTSPVVYTVTAADGTTQNYTVTVTIEQGWVDVGSAGFSTGIVADTKIAFNPSTNEPYVAYLDAANGGKATVMKFDGTAWVNVGTAGLSAGQVEYTSLAFNPSTNQPYVAYRDRANGSKATVMMYDGSAWVAVGTPGFSAGQAKYTSIAFNPSTNQPYVVYSDAGSSNKATVMTFNGSAWVAVSTPGFSAGQAKYTSIAFNPSTNQPYVVYQDDANGGKATVMKFDGTAWVAVGTPGFSAGYAGDTSIAFSPSTNQPYVVYSDGGNSSKATVMMYDGTAWVNVGSAGFSAGSVMHTDIAFDPATNKPYVVYMNVANSNKATVMMYDGSAWVAVGTPGFSAGAASYTSIAFNPSTNQPYVVYSDGENNYKATVMSFN